MDIIFCFFADALVAFVFPVLITAASLYFVSGDGRILVALLPDVPLTLVLVWAYYRRMEFFDLPTW